ncbi:MAG TPA: hypothetical protein VG722_05830, partial [Tepidisphaeraceae bacterium]|nr:hypothetical protein [Tepidisphaeraceae bacterium]
MSTKLNRATPIRSIEISYFLQISTDFTKRQNLVRDQEVGGSKSTPSDHLFSQRHTLFTQLQRVMPLVSAQVLGKKNTIKR